MVETTSDTMHLVRYSFMEKLFADPSCGGAAGNSRHTETAALTAVRCTRPYLISGVPSDGWILTAQHPVNSSKGAETDTTGHPVLPVTNLPRAVSVHSAMLSNIQ